MKIKLALLFCFIMCFLGTSVHAEAASRNSGDFTYTVLGDGTAEITDYSGYADTLTIPSELDDFAVSSIDDLAFKNCTNLISVIIPDSVTSIGDWVFSDCSNLASVIIYGNITSIGDWVFSNCQSLTSVMIPDSVTSIGERAFYNCQSLKSVIIPDNVTFIGDGAFMECRSLTTVTIPDGVTTIGDMVFYDCQSLALVTIPNNVTSIGALAFEGCSNLISVTIPDSVTSIGDQAFFNCQNLTSLTIPDSVTSIGAGAFAVSTSSSDSLTQSSSSAHSVHSLDVDLTPGDYVTFGYYEQDNNRANGSEEIEWLTLDVQNDKALLISRYALDSVPYHNRFADVTWQNCDLRSWLNEDFLNTAFSDEEQAVIVMTDVDNSVNQGNRDWNTNGGNNTRDKVFLLSCKEVEQYFPSETGRVCKPTAYGVDRGIYTKGDLCLWLLRSPGMDQYNIANVNIYGTFWDTGVNNNQYAIRPALWVNLGSEHVEDDNTIELSAEQNDKYQYERLVPYVVFFGYYEQDNNRPNGFEKIEWVVLDVKDGKALLISRYGLDVTQDYYSENWQNSSLRSWLNEDFLKAAFSDEEKAAILATDVDNSINQGNRNWYKDGGNNTTDKIFLLSYREARQYFPSKVDRICKPTAYCLEQGIVQNNCGWYLRTSNFFVGTNGTFYGLTSNNTIYPHSPYRVIENIVAVRPAFWVDLETDIFKSENSGSDDVESLFYFKTKSDPTAIMLYELGNNPDEIIGGKGIKVVVFNEDDNRFERSQLLPDAMQASSSDEIGYVFRCSSELYKREEVGYKAENSISSLPLPDKFVTYLHEVFSVKVTDASTGKVLIESSVTNKETAPDTIDNSVPYYVEMKLTDAEKQDLLKSLCERIGLKWIE